MGGDNQGPDAPPSSFSPKPQGMLIIGEGEGCLDEEQSNDAQSVGGWGTSATLSNLNRAAKPSVSA